MRYVILAVILVAVMIGGLLWGPEYWEKWKADGSDTAAPNEAGFVDLPAPDAPDYSTVVTDEARAQELQQEAEGYLKTLSQKEDDGLVSGKPLLLTANSQLSWAGEDSSVADLLDRYGIQNQAGQLYFAHRVSHDDKQGVWGIVQSGLITRFAEGIAAHRGDSQQVYTLLIPQRADERNADGSSSFLGKVIWHKTMQARVVNTERGLARASSELVVPVQDLVIVGFEPQELVAVYQYFAVASQGQ